MQYSHKQKSAPQYHSQPLQSQNQPSHEQPQTTVSTALFVFFVNEAYSLYGDLALFKDNDHLIFERLVRTPLSEATDAKEKLHALIHRFHFFPLSDLCSKPIAENIYYLARIDLSLVADLSRNGFDLSPVSDSVMERVMLHPYLNERYLKRYIDAGFILSDLCIKRTLASGKAHIITVLHSIIDKETLYRLACDTIYDLFGPYLDRQTSLNIPWSSETVQRLIHMFSIPERVIEKALLTNPSSSCTFDTVHPEFPVTRSYLKTKPYPIWQWVLSTYGPHHLLTIACADDALSRAVADQELHDLHDVFLDAGFVLRPRHIKILACRVLHRNMTANALHVFRHLRDQLLERQLKTSLESCANENQQPSSPELFEIPVSPPPSPPASPLMPVTRLPHDDINCIGEQELIAFRKALSEEVVDNPDWINRMRTVQLEGGPRGGAVRIDRPPEDGIRFLEEARRLLSELRVPPPSVITRKRNTLPKRKHSTYHRYRPSALSAIVPMALSPTGSPQTTGRSRSRSPILSPRMSRETRRSIDSGSGNRPISPTMSGQSYTSDEDSDGTGIKASSSWIRRMQAWWRTRAQAHSQTPHSSHIGSSSMSPQPISDSNSV